MGKKKKKRHDPTRRAEPEMWKSWLRGNPDYSEKHVATAVVKIYTDEEWKFIKAMDRLKRDLRRMPTCKEVLERARGLGYVRSGVAD